MPLTPHSKRSERPHASLPMGLNKFWYSYNAVAIALLPLSWLFRGIVWLRRRFYRWRNRFRRRLPAPVIVVGNITVGGTGKTPLVIWLASYLQSKNYRPGIVSRGYGGRAKRWPRLVAADSDPALAGDEPVLIAKRSGCPVVAAPDRVRAARTLLERFDCNVIISDDGLQHYALMRDIEIAVIDGARRFGNGWCLPAGPLREPLTRLREVDFVITNRVIDNGTARDNEYTMALYGEVAVNLGDSLEQQTLGNFRGQTVHAVAGIGNPERFFNLLRACGLEISAHPFPDHHSFSAADLDFNDELPLLMTEKDAVKCRAFARRNQWYVPVSAAPDKVFAKHLIEQLRSDQGGQKIA